VVEVRAELLEELRAALMLFQSVEPPFTKRLRERRVVGGEGGKLAQALACGRRLIREAL
jgi:hypothetical protein